MAEGAERLASLIVVGGPLKDRRYDLEEVVTEVLIGSDPDCHLHIDLPGISPIHARLWADLGSATAHDTHAPRGLYVNDEQVEGEAPVRSGDWLWLGPPAEAESVCIQCRFESWVEVLPEAEAAVAEAPPPEAAPPPSSESRGGAASPPPPLEAYEPVVLGDVPALESGEPPSAGPEPTAGEPVPAPPEPATAAPEPVPAPPEPTPVAPEPVTAPPQPVPTPAPHEPAAAEDPFFVGAEAAEPLVPADRTGPIESAPPPATSEDDAWAIAEPPASAKTPAAPPEDHFFIAEELLTEGAAPAPSVEAEAPIEDLLFVEADPPPSLMTDPAPAVDPGGQSGEPAAPPEAPALPSPELMVRAPLPPRQAETGPAPAPVSPPAAEGEAGVTEPSPEIADPPPEPVPDRARPTGSAPLSDEVVMAAEQFPAAFEAPAAPETPPDPEIPPAPGGASPGAPRERPAAPAARPTAPSAARRAPAAGARRPAPRRGGAPDWLRPVGLGAGIALVVGVIGVALVSWLGGSVSVADVSPSRLRVGQRAVLTGSGFSDEPARNTVLFGGTAAKVLTASATRLEVEVPEAVAEAGAERRVPVVVRKGDLESDPLEVSVFQGPRLHGLSPDAALPGEEVVLAGAGWGIGATVRFGDVAAQVLEVDPTQIRVTVPPLPGGYGTPAPVVVTVGGVESNPAPFFFGRLPLVTAVRPPAVAMGDVLTVSGRGFEPDAGHNEVRVAGARALVVAATGDELQVVVPRLPPGSSGAVEVRVPGSQDVGQAVIEPRPAADPIELRFVAEPFDGPSAHPHSVLTTGLGPAFVLAAADGRSAAERALAAQQALNAAVVSLAGSPGVLPEARDLDTRPVIGVPGQPEALLEVTEEDAAAYNEDWTRLRGRGRPVTPARLARWWEAVARDLVLMLVRGEAPRFAAALAPEGRALQQVFDAARRSGDPGISAEVVAGLRRGVHDGLRVIALRVPPSVTASAPPAAGVAAAVPTPPPAPRARPLRLQGTWTGSENEQGRQRYLTVTFRGDYGSIAYEEGLTLTVPFLKLEQPGRDRVRFTVQIRGGIRHYLGRWDGEALGGDIARDEAGRDVVGTFELRPR